MEHEPAGGGGYPGRDGDEMGAQGGPQGFGVGSRGGHACGVQEVDGEAAQDEQAALAANFSDGAWARGPFFNSACLSRTCSMMAWSRWVSPASGGTPSPR